MAAYTFSCFSVFTKNYEDEERRVLIRQNVLMFLMQFIAFAVMYLSTDDMRILFIYAALMIVLLGVILLYNLIYPSVSRWTIGTSMPWQTPCMPCACILRCMSICRRKARRKWTASRGRKWASASASFTMRQFKNVNNQNLII